MMKAVVKNNYLNTRMAQPSVNAEKLLPLPPGTEIITDGHLYLGDRIEGIDTWVKDLAGNYYWTGGLIHEITTVPIPAKVAAPSGQVTFSWFNHLRIADIWRDYGIKGEGVKVAILDTGYNRRADLKPFKGKICVEQSEYPGVKLVIDDQSDDMHGTRCASLAGSLNSKNHIVGIAPDCQLLVGKISIDGSLNFKNLIKGIDWAVKEGADIISVSYFESLTPSEKTFYESELQKIVNNKNVMLFACAGNTNTNERNEYYPASFREFTSIGASTLNNTISAVTVDNDKTILHAPGENIECYGNGTVPTPITGTSFSTPIVAGIAALAISLLKKKNNSWNAGSLLNVLEEFSLSTGKNPAKKIIDPVNIFRNL